MATPSARAHTASNNTVTISNIQSNAWVVGGVVDTGAGGDANNNTVTIPSGTMGSVNGASPNATANTTGNVVNIQGATITGQWDKDAQAQVLGGVMGADVFHGTASSNTIVITGGTINGLIAGGYVDDEKDYDNAQATGSVINNTTPVQGNTADLSQAPLFGGWGATPTGDFFTRNTPNLVDVKGPTVQEVGNFEFLNFALSESTQNGDTILTVTGTADIQGSTIGVRVLGNEPVLEVGDTVSLIEAGELKADSTIKTRGLQGSTIEYAFDTQQNGNTLTSTVTRRGATESTPPKTFLPPRPPHPPPPDFPPPKATAPPGPGGGPKPHSRRAKLWQNRRRFDSQQHRFARECAQLQSGGRSCQGFAAGQRRADGGRLLRVRPRQLFVVQ